MEGVYNNIPEGNQVTRACNVAVNLCLKYEVQIMSIPVLNVLYFYLAFVLSEVRVVHIVAVFCCSLISAYPSCF
jgi:hypothetical protein